MARIAVIGAGAGGMAAAIRLAAARHDVSVYEQGQRPGGKLATLRHDGFAFDTGPSMFTIPAVYRDLFLNTGAALEDCVDLQAVDPAFGYWFADGSSVTVPGVGVTRIADAFADSFGGTAGTDWSRLMERAARMWQVTREPFLQSPLKGWRTLMSMATSISDVRTVAPNTTLRALGREYLSDPRMRTVLERYATYTGSDPRKAPAVLATVPYVEQAFGAWHIGGGLGTLAEALATRCEQLGVTMHLGCDVRRIRLVDGRVAGLELGDGTSVPADIVVANADASQVYGTLVDDPRAAKALSDLGKATPSLAGFVVLLALRGRTPGLRHHNVWFPADYDGEFDSIFGRNPRPVDDPAIYVCSPDDPLMRPDDDHESWFVLVNAPRHSPGGRAAGTIDWSVPGLAENYAQHVLKRLAERGTDVRDRVMWSQVSTPADLEQAVRAPGGAIYGTSSNGARAAFQRPANASAIPGLYLVGGSAHPGGGLPLVGMGAQIVADLIAGAKSG